MKFGKTVIHCGLLPVCNRFALVVGSGFINVLRRKDAGQVAAWPECLTLAGAAGSASLDWWDCGSIPAALKIAFETCRRGGARNHFSEPPFFC